MRAYREILRTPGAALFSATGCAARLPLSMAGLGIVLLTELRTGSYGKAGVIAAIYVLVAAVSGPVQGRLADRFRQAPVLWVAGVLHASGVALLIATLGEDPVLPGIAAVVAGLGAPQAGNLVRTRWVHALRERGGLDTAFAFEAVLDEVVFVVGPVLVTFLTLQVHEVSGLLASGAISTLASWGLALQRRTEPPVAARTDEPAAPLNLPLLASLALAATGVGVLFGSTEVIVAAFTDEAGRQDLAGVVLAVWAFGSLAAGLAVGALPAPRSPVRRFRWTLLGLTALFLPMPWIIGVPALTGAMLLAGVMIAPTMIAMTQLVEINVAPTRLTESLGWVTTGIAAGVALGAAASGRVIDAEGASAGFFVPLAAGAVAAGIAWGFVRSKVRVTGPSSH